MTEDQEFELLEQRQRQKRDTEIFMQASTAAAQFVQVYQNELAIMSLRKAFELGFRAGTNFNKEGK